MNILIAIVSEAFGDIMTKPECSKNFMLVDLLIELETFMIWGRCRKPFDAYLVFAEQQE
jgi:hypothetical protein